MHNKFTGYKINAQKSLAFLCTKNLKTERVIKAEIMFTITMKRIKPLGINLPKGTEYLHKENYKTIIKEIKDDRNRQNYAIYVY